MSRKKRGGWSEIDGKRCFVLPYSMLSHPNMRLLSPYGHKLINDLALQYTGSNNGYLCCAWSLMKDRGWRSKETLHKTMCELEHYGLIQRTQQGGLNRPNLHAFSWRRIDEMPDRWLEVVPTNKPSDAWKVERERFVYQQRKRTRAASNRNSRPAPEKLDRPVREVGKASTPAVPVKRSIAG